MNIRVPIADKKRKYENFITRSSWPMLFKTLNIKTPIEEPRTPPNNKMIPILISTFPLFQCERTPDTDGDKSFFCFNNKYFFNFSKTWSNFIF